MRETTLCYIEKNDSYLMLHRTRKKPDGSFEKWLGVGGKLEAGETPMECVIREAKEETGYTLKDCKYRAKIYFYSDTWEDEIMYLYTATEFEGTQIECNEGELVWVKKSEVANLKIWEGDKLFLQKLAEDSPYFELELRYKGDDLDSYKWLDTKDEVYLPGQVCSECKGMCCKSNGCSLSPEDLLKLLGDKKPDRENILEILKNNPYAIDSASDGRGRLFFIRMRHKCFTFIGVDAMGECAMLTETGCAFDYEHRPKGGRYLEAVRPGQCVQHYTLEMMKKDWSPFQEILQSIWNEYEPIFSSDGTFDKCEEDYMNYQRKLREKRA